MSDILGPGAVTALDTFYETTLKPRLDAIEAARRQVRWLIAKALMAVLPPIAVLIAGDLIENVLPLSPTLVGVTGVVWLAAGIVFALVKCLLPGIAAYATYRNRFKQDIVGGIFSAVVPSAVYDPLQGITEAVFDAPGLFNTRGAFQCDDRVRGHIGRTPFEASEAGRAYRTGSGKSAHTYVVFRGLFCQLDFQQQLDGVTLIDPARARSYQLGDRRGLRQVVLDHPAFDKEFKVHASSETEARALLTTAMMERLLALGRQVDSPLFLAFKGRRAYVAVHYGRTLFETRDRPERVEGRRSRDRGALRARADDRARAGAERARIVDAGRRVAVARTRRRTEPAFATGRRQSRHGDGVRSLGGCVGVHRRWREGRRGVGAEA